MDPVGEGAILVTTWDILQYLQINHQFSNAFNFMKA